MKKILGITLCMALCLAIGFPAGAAELTADAVTANNVPASYATVKDGKVVLGTIPTAYSPDATDAILRAYGGTFQNAAKVPASYTTVTDGKAVFAKNPIAYSPNVLNEIITAYGFSTTPEALAKIVDPTSYATVRDGQVVFGQQGIAYSPDAFDRVMAAYNLPVVKPAPAPAPPPPPPVVKTPPKKPSWVFNDIKFDFDKATLRPESYSVVDGIYEALRDNPELAVEIQGHTCAIGTDAYNMGLSQRRANTVLNYLQNKGIDSSRLSAKGFGESQPIDSNKTKEGRANNRRVEFKPMQ
ncbi:MAG: OmpA family protein [Desulfobacterales bacterium]|jgi:OOP family OmpA-OmpF porin|nr:OmpA family protein [Desulfobacteraceae bacterium]MDY0312229.1 OmpA family protein [Desulfobacterales bacterium]